MVAHLQTVTDDRPLAAPPAGTGHRPTTTQRTAQRLADALSITRALQSTLDVERLIELFSAQTHPLVAHDGMVYRNASQAILFKIGHEAHHSCTYRLMMGSQNLGELEFLRGMRFSSREIARLEELLTLLLQPLRNTLLYRYALWSASKDPLTGINNRGAMDTALRREVELAHRHETPLSLLVMDIDHFKSVNDRYGHTMGDCALRHVADCAASCIRGSDMLFRYGGEEFVVLTSNTEWFGGLMLAERLRTAIEAMECTCNEVRLRMTVSLGVSTLEADDDPAALFARADEALYQAKLEGRNQAQFTDRAAG
jgi:diguanylate cyclase (GGDEF)-like protein